jgi:histidinol-phosphate aminotransferase
MNLAADARPVVRQLVRSAEPKAGRIGLLRLDLNERPVALPEQVTAGILEALRADVLTAYPEVRPLYERLAAHHGIDPSQLAITAGSEMAIRYLFEAYLTRGDRLVILDPSFAMFEVYATLCGARVTAVPYRRDCQLEVADVLAAITPGTRLVAIANPNNPTGTAFTDAELRKLIERAGDVGALFLSDEAYYYFHEGTALPWLAAYPHLIVSRTFSKAWGLAGIRLGYAASHPDIIAAIQKLQPIDHVGSLAVAAGLEMLNREALVREYAGQVRAARSEVGAALRALGCIVLDSSANFLLVDAGHAPQLIAEALCARDILVGTGLRLPFPHRFLRVTLGPFETMRPFVEAMRAILEEM